MLVVGDKHSVLYHDMGSYYSRHWIMILLIQSPYFDVVRDSTFVSYSLKPTRRDGQSTQQYDVGDSIAMWYSNCSKQIADQCAPNQTTLYVIQCSGITMILDK